MSDEKTKFDNEEVTLLSSIDDYDMEVRCLWKQFWIDYKLGRYDEKLDKYDKEEKGQKDMLMELMIN